MKAKALKAGLIAALLSSGAHADWTLDDVQLFQPVAPSERGTQ